MRVLFFVFLMLVMGGAYFLQSSPPDAILPAARCGSFYQALPGETLPVIAGKCGVQLADLLALNPEIAEQGEPIQAGQRLRLPGHAAEGDAGLQSPTPAEVQVNPAGIPVTGLGQDGEVYQVKPGDSLARIAKEHGLTLDDLLLANPQVTNPNLVLIDQNIQIPSASDLENLRSEVQRQAELRQQQIAAQIEHNGERWIDVDLATQTVRAYEGSQVVRTFVVSTGLPGTPTVTGQYSIWMKLRYDDMSGPGYDLKNVPYVMYFYKGYGLHGTYWHNNFGSPMSHGCVNLSEEDAAWLFDFASEGTLVNIH